MSLGLILTHTASALAFRRALDACAADWIKIVPAWCPLSPRDLASLGRSVVVRTSWGDPSYANGLRAYPDPTQIVAEVAPYVGMDAPSVMVEIGNEPSGYALDPARYTRDLAATIAALRTQWPDLPILAPAHSPQAPDREYWIRAMAPVLRQCDALSIHVYLEAQADTEIALLRRHVSSTLPIWATELNIGQSLDPLERAARLDAWLDVLPVAVALLYHWDDTPGPPLPQQGSAVYRLDLTTLSHLETLAPMHSDTMHYPDIRVPNFAMDVRQWRTVAAFRQHLARYHIATTAPWSRGVVIHHTYRPVAADWRGVASLEALARFYRRDVEPGGWPSGPHLFIASGAANPDHDGIWQLTPLNLTGTHARTANPSYWGIEHVCDATTQSMPMDVAALGAGATAALLDWARLPANVKTITPHSAWGKPSCPGAGTDMAAYRRAVMALQIPR